jgi:Ca2+-binding EF-hand superfamily protein
MEAMKAQQAALAAARAEEQKKREEDMAAKRAEQQAILAIRRVMQAFRSTPPDKFEEQKTKLDEVVAQELEKTGSQKETMTAEIEQTVKATQERIAKMEEARKKAEEQKEAENARRRELKAKAEELLGELEKLVEKAETSTKGVGEELEPLTGEKDMKMNEVEACASSVEEAAKEANAACQACTDFCVKEGPNIKNTPPIMGEPKSTCFDDLTKLTGRISEAKKSITVTLGKCVQTKALRIKRVQAKDKYEKGLAPFKKFDADKDGKLSRKEIQAFSKGVYGFSIPADTLDTIQRLLIKDGAKGVEKQDFHKMKTMIGVAREAALDAKKKEEREKREKLVADLKEKLQAKITKTAELITAAVEATVKAETQVKPLNSAQSKDMKAAEMISKADETDTIIDESKASLTTAKEAVTALNTDVEVELKGFLAGEVKKLDGSLKPLDARNTKAAAVSAKFRVDAAKKNNEELEKLRSQGLSIIFHHQGAKELLKDALYAAFDSKKKGKVEEGAFVKFFATCEMKKSEDGEEDPRLSEDDAGRVFDYLDSESKGHLTEEEFQNLTRKFMKVVKASVLTDDISIKSKPVRRLVEGEVLEALTGPQKEEPDSEIARIRVKAMSDDVEGWVTPTGNQGTVFLEEGGNMFKVVKETILTGAFVIGENTTPPQKDRKLKVGEVVEVREWAKKEEASGLMRMKVRVKSDGQIGFATSLGNTGIVFLEVV